jgi:hypothetical protein
MLSRATGQVYGSAYIWRFEKAWQTNLDTPGVIQLSYMRNLFGSQLNPAGKNRAGDGDWVG